VTQQADKLFELYRQKLLAGKLKENSQTFNEDFYLPLYLPLWLFIIMLVVQCTIPCTNDKCRHCIVYNRLSLLIRMSFVRAIVDDPEIEG
jgi:hypothetical protein